MSCLISTPKIKELADKFVDESVETITNAVGVWQDFNGKTLEEYLPLETLRMVVKAPFEVTETVGQYDVNVNVYGGGLTGQAGAMRHAISRALLEIVDDYRPKLKEAGFLTRDSRAKERKKYGLKAARKAPQYSKR